MMRRTKMKKRSSKLLAITLFVISITILLPTISASANTVNSFTIAHRGASGQAPENTMAAFDKALEYHADYFEVDVQMTKDGELILMHDTTVDRTTNGTGAVKDFTFEEIRQLDAGSWFHESFAGEKVPTLGEALDRHNGEIGILIELKNPELYPGIEQKIADELVKRNITNENSNIIVQSFNWESVKRIHQLLPSVPTGVLIGYGQTIGGKITDEQLASFQTYADYVNPDKNLLNQETVDRIHQHALKTWPYTINDRNWVTQLIEWGVDGIITDYPLLVNMPASATTIKTLVERFEGKELSSETAHALKIHLTTVSQYEEQGLQDKVMKHMNGFITLLNEQKKNGLISDRGYQLLLSEANFLMEKR
jgi:glycerophosphoryl diester phosphodiesterase